MIRLHKISPGFYRWNETWKCRVLYKLGNFVPTSQNHYAMAEHFGLAEGHAKATCSRFPIPAAMA